jgi:hypothetical protein
MWHTCSTLAFVGVAAFAATLFGRPVSAQSGTICVYLDGSGAGDPPCSDDWEFGCYDASAIQNTCTALSSEGIYSYSVTGVSDADAASCNSFSSARSMFGYQPRLPIISSHKRALLLIHEPDLDSIAWFFELYDDTDCTGVGATYV